MNALTTRIREAILTDGPMPISLFMLMCLHDRRDGYYATRPAFNRDFTTAPETSQVFGELLGAWAAHEWQALGSPNPFHLVELGPGRAAMMADLLRATRNIPGFHDDALITLVEASPILRRVQTERLAPHAVTFADSLEAAPPGPAIILANEFLDCLPVRQYVRAEGANGGQWRERSVGLSRDGQLQFGVGLPADLPPDLTPQADEAEAAPALETIADAIARRFATSPGRALFLDYGPMKATPGDTLRAFENGKQVHPLANPGHSDLTADVDFARLKRLCEKAGLAVYGPVEQGYFLNRLGAGQRAMALARANPERGKEIVESAMRLVAEEDMGSRFKAICITPAATTAPAGFE